MGLAQKLKGMGKGKWIGKGKGKGKGLRSFKPDCRVWIGNLADGVTWKDLQEHMNQSGKTKWCEVFEKHGAGTGAVAYASADEAANAINTLHGSELGGQTIECDAWEKKEK